MDHTDAPLRRYNLPLTRFAVPKACTAGQTPPVRATVRARRDGLVRGELVVRRRPLRAGTAVRFNETALMVAAWTIPTPLCADTTSP